MPVTKKRWKKRNVIQRISELTKSNMSILPFEEHPDAPNGDRIGAHDLFSLFTASIIKKKTSFTR
jgi:hypothetical protein